MSLDIELYIMVDTGGDHKHEFSLFEANITHNLTDMANSAGIYTIMWRPENVAATKAKHLIMALKVGVTQMELNPAHFKRFDSSNGWGTYDQFLPWVKSYLEACKMHPEALIRVCR